MRSIITLVMGLGLVCLSSGQNVPNVDEALAKVNEVIDLPQLKNLNLSALSGLGAGLNVSQLPIADVENAFRKKCEKNGSPKAYDNAKQASTQVVECLRGLVDFTQLKKEMDEARPTGDLDEVFKKYCLKKPILKNCLLNYTASIEPCLDEQEKENKKIIHNITEKILNFVCFKEGDRIALFVAAKGPECFQSKAQPLIQCANSTFISSGVNATLPFNPANGLAGLPKITDIPSLVFDQKSCRNMNTLQSCVVDVLEGCEDPTPANLLNSIFNYIKKVTPCEKLLAS